MSRLSRKISVAFVALMAAASTANAGLWEVIGNFTPGMPSEAVAISADGSVIVGSSGTPTGQRAFRWTLDTGIQALPMPVGASVAYTWATDVSADGSTVVGYGGNSFSTRVGWEGLVWQNSATPTEVAVAGKGVWLNGVSGDGSIATGTMHGTAALDLSEAFRYPIGGVVSPLSGQLYPGANVQSNATAISKDGSTIVGDTVNLDPIIRSAFQWTEAGGMTAVGDFSANAVSRDGSAVVGAMNSANGFQAYRWTQTGGLTPLSYGPGYTNQALGVSGDGKVVVGFVENTSSDLRQAFYWKEGMSEMRLLQDVLVERYGFDLSGWTLTKAYAVSDDGRTVVGRGYSPQGTDEAWRAVLAPEPGSWALLGMAGLGLAVYGWQRRSRTARSC